MHLIILHGVYHVFDRCRKIVNPQGNPLNWKRTCLRYEDNRANYGFWWYEGYVFWNTCPRNWRDVSVRQKCQDEDKRDPLDNLPVFDKDSHVTYRNIFCARCNGAVNTTYWRLQFDCAKWFNTTAFNLSESMDFLNSKCAVRKSPSSSQLTYLTRCIPRFHDCLEGSQEQNESYCQTECLRYAFPICVRWQIRFRNPQCALCNGIKPWRKHHCQRLGFRRPRWALTILFDFSSTSKYSIAVDDKKLNLQQTIKHVWSCALNEVYDPYTGKCKMIVSTAGSESSHRQNKVNAFERNTRNETELSQNCFCIPFNQSEYEPLPNDTVYIKPHNKIYSNTSYTICNEKLLLCVNFSRNATTMACEQSIIKTNTTPASLETELSQNCLLISFNQSDYKKLPNGSVYIKPHNKIYSNTSYTIRNNKLLLCVNFSRNATATASEQSFSRKTKTTPASLQILTSIGCTVSMVSLVLLLITYMLLAELRNLPGKIIINLALSLLAYQAMFFSAVETPLANQEQCLVIAVLLHFFVLSSFTWMNVMAYDVHRTFTTSGKLNPPICISYIHFLLLIAKIMDVLVVPLLKGPSGMSFNRVMSDHVNVPMPGFVGNSLDLTSSPAFYLQERERERNLSRINFFFSSTFILLIIFHWLSMNHLKKMP